MTGGRGPASPVVFPPGRFRMTAAPPSSTVPSTPPAPTDATGIEQAVAAALAAIAAAGDLDALKTVRLAHAGDRSPLALANRALADLPKAERAAPGRLIGQSRAQVNKAIAAREAELVAQRDARILREEAVDVTLPYDREPAGSRHPISTVMARIEDIFVAMGWEVATGPELEAEWFNFDALNFPKDHPARAMQDSFYIAGSGGRGSGGRDETGLVLRTHTSPVQVRSMLDREPPIYVVCTGRVYR